MAEERVMAEETGMGEETENSETANQNNDDNWRSCKVCDVSFETKDESVIHSGETEHLEKKLVEEEKRSLKAVHLDMMAAWDRKSDFFCHICEIDCAFEDEYANHVKSAKHKKRELTHSAVLKGDENQTATVEAKLALIGEPMIGLEFIQEFDSKRYDGTLDYRCYLCSHEALNIYNISSHVISPKHRKRYLQLKHHEIWKQVLAAGRKNFFVANQKFAREVEEKFGRQKILRLEEEFSEKFPDTGTRNVTSA